MGHDIFAMENDIEISYLRFCAGRIEMMESETELNFYTILNAQSKDDAIAITRLEQERTASKPKRGCLLIIIAMGLNPLRSQLY